MTFRPDDTISDHQHQYDDWSLERLGEVSRTFALSLQFLPQPLEYHLSNAYLLCRIPDTIEDTNKLTAQQKSDLLYSFSQVMNEQKSPSEFVSEVTQTFNESAEDIAQKNDDWNLVMETEKSFELYQSFDKKIQDAIRPWVIELTEGMKTFVDRYSTINGVRVQTLDELDEYCYYVAGTVGHLITDTVCTYYDIEPTDKIHQASEEYGLFLQIVNISKDVYDDYETENNVYLPAENLVSFGVNPNQVLIEDNADNVEQVLLEVLDHGESYAEGAREFLEWIEKTPEQGSVFVSLSLPYLLAVATIRDLREESELATDPEEVKISREEVMNITQHINDLNTNKDISVENLEQKIQSGVFK